ncbi:hypothetical protein PPACK8108_LOCUS9051, partial [Phakopsora pachyrhizi]
MRAMDQGHGHNQRMSRAVGEWGVTQKGIFSKSIVTRNKTYKNPIKPDWRPFCERRLRQEHLITPGYRRRIQSRPGVKFWKLQRIVALRLRNNITKMAHRQSSSRRRAEEIGTHYKSSNTGSKDGPERQNPRALMGEFWSGITNGRRNGSQTQTKAVCVRTPHLEDGGDGGAAEDRERLCESFDGLWKPGGQGY